MFNTIPFGFKASAYIYNTAGYVPVSYCRNLGVPMLLYIDDRFIGEWQSTTCGQVGGYKNATLRSLYIVCQVLIILDYYLNLDKCAFDPVQNLNILGLICDFRFNL